jgi:hypothetical protein
VGESATRASHFGRQDVHQAIISRVFSQDHQEWWPNGVPCGQGSSQGGGLSGPEADQDEAWERMNQRCKTDQLQSSHRMARMLPQVYLKF